jgi:hypothetical protein
MARVKIAQNAPSIDAEIAHLRGLGLQALRARWRMSFGRDAPPPLARHLLFAMLAYRLQAESFGDLDAATLRLLEKIELAPSRQAAVPLTRAFEHRRRDLSPGTVLTREWGGRHHRVLVLDGGFVWDGGTYASLSKVAQAITGTRWNGPRFFGLRNNKQAETIT